MREASLKDKDNKFPHLFYLSAFIWELVGTIKRTMRLKTYFLCSMLFFLTGSLNCTGQSFRTQKKPEVLFDNIYIGDKLESCLANGTVQNNPDYNVRTLAPKFDNDMFELANSNIANANFTYTGVEFDENNIVREIRLKYHQKETGKTAKEVFNYMTQYFCQRYQGMKTEEVNEDWKTDSYDLKYQKRGMKNIWETNKLKIILKSYNAIRTDKSSTYDENGQWSSYLSVREDVARRYYNGNWVELEIIAK